MPGLRQLRRSELLRGGMVRLYEARTVGGRATVIDDIGFTMGHPDGVSDGIKVSAGAVGLILGPAPEPFIAETDRTTIMVLADGRIGWVYDVDCFTVEEE